jgi:hypothetical protein
MPDRTPEVQRTLAAMDKTVADLQETSGGLEETLGHLRGWLIVVVIALVLAIGGGVGWGYSYVHQSHVRQHDQAAARCRQAQAMADGLDEFGDAIVDQLFATDPHQAEIRSAVQAAAARAKARLLAGTDCAPETAVPATITGG